MLFRSLIYGFDDSVTDDSQNMVFDSTCRIFLRNYAAGNIENIKSGSSYTEITGSNSLLVKFSTNDVSGGYNLFYTGSQYSYSNSSYVSGTYYADILINSFDNNLVPSLAVSSSLRFTPIWTSLDGTVLYQSGSILTVNKPNRGSSLSLKNYVVNVLNVKDSYKIGDEALVKVNIFDKTNPIIFLVKLPTETPGVVVKNVYYEIRDAITDEVLIPHDAEKDATKVSADDKGMYFEFDPSSLYANRTYVIDIVIDHNGRKMRYKNASQTFKVEA